MERSRFSPTAPQRHTVRRWLAWAAAGSVALAAAGCASSGSTASDAGARSGSSVEVFGVIDAAVSHSTNKSDRR